jgi:hypothetical protein
VVEARSEVENNTNNYRRKNGAKELNSCLSRFSSMMLFLGFTVVAIASPLPIMSIGFDSSRPLISHKNALW